MTQENFRCGYVALVGRPNAGKSTLLNQILGSKLAITSAKPQTTRNRIAGIHNEEGVQVILVDTPGVHRAWTELNRAMVDRALGAVRDVDVVCLIVDVASRAQRLERNLDVLDADDQALLETLERHRVPVVLVANKIDVVPKPLLLPVLAAFSERLSLAAAVPLSALTGDGVDRLLSEIRARLPEHPPLFPTDEWAQVSERFLVAEIIREKIFHLLEQEIPYSTFVEIERFDEERRDDDDLVRIFAKVVVERKSQKGIVIGRGGEMIKRISSSARREIERVLGCRVYLELFVAVERDWTRTKRGLRRVGFDDLDS